MMALDLVSLFHSIRRNQAVPLLPATESGATEMLFSERGVSQE